MIEEDSLPVGGPEVAWAGVDHQGATTCRREQETGSAPTREFLTYTPSINQ